MHEVNFIVLESELFELNFAPVAVILVGIVALLLLLCLTFYRAMIVRPARYKARCSVVEECAVDACCQDVSVLLLAEDDPERVERVLRALLSQRYAGDFEIVIVNDGSKDAMDAVVARLREAADRVRLTFIPNEAYNLSRRKLAITLGMKAARYPYVIVLDSLCCNVSAQWLACMARHFAAGHRIVLGYRYYINKPGAVVGTDHLIETVTWLSAAIGGCPYRSCEVYLGLERQLFFDNKGFARTLNLHGGEDDLFIREVASSDNCVVELSEDSMVAAEVDDIDKAYRQSRLSHGFTSRRLPKRFRRFIRLMTASLWISVGLTVATALLSWPMLIPAIAAAIMTCGQWVVAILAWRRVARALNSGLSLGALIGGLVMSPLYTVWAWLKSRFNTERNFTWY